MTHYLNVLTQMVGPFHPSSKTNGYQLLKCIHLNGSTPFIHLQRLAIVAHYLNLFIQMVGPFHPSSKTNDYHSLLKCIHPNGFDPFHPSSKTSSYRHSLLLKCIHPNSWTHPFIHLQRLAMITLTLLKNLFIQIG
jgi:hypothetical protein